MTTYTYEVIISTDNESHKEFIVVATDVAEAIKEAASRIKLTQYSKISSRRIYQEIIYAS